MLLHTKLINIFSSDYNNVKIELLEVDNTSGASQTNTLFEGKIDVNNCVFIIESEFERLESKGQEPKIMVYELSGKDVHHQPKGKIFKRVEFFINIYL